MSKHFFVTKLCRRLEMRTPDEVIADMTYKELPLTYDHLNWFFDTCYDVLMKKSILQLLFMYILGIVPKLK